MLLVRTSWLRQGNLHQGERWQAAIAGMETCPWSATHHLYSPDLPWHTRDRPRPCSWRRIDRSGGRLQRRKVSAERFAIKMMMTKIRELINAQYTWEWSGLARQCSIVHTWPVQSLQGTCCWRCDPEDVCRSYFVNTDNLASHINRHISTIHTTTNSTRLRCRQVEFDAGWGNFYHI